MNLKLRTSISVILCALSGSTAALGASSQTTLPQVLDAPSPTRIVPAPSGLTLPITFSEFAQGTSITTQYSSLGIIFGGDSPFITSDGSNPTSPVLSGSPIFSGAIEGLFVNPADGKTPTVVAGFGFDAGFFDEFGSTRLEWFDPKGNSLGQQINPSLGITRFEVETGNIASFRIEIFGNRPAGYAIDNFDLEPLGPSVLFREKREGFKDGSWLLLGDSVPGFDHTAFHSDNLVYESHPGYGSGVYVDAAGEETVTIGNSVGVQSQFSRLTFLHASMSQSNTSVTAIDELPIPSEDLAIDMRDFIDPLVGSSGFQFLCANNLDLDCLQQNLSPAAQKGGNNTYTCVGLVEAAAEAAGHNGGEGFVPSAFESFTVGARDIPMLSPEVLNVAMKGQLDDSIFNFIRGLFDPVDFIITDPLGRRIGFVTGEGSFDEIPRAYYSGDGGLEQVIIPNPIAGRYTLELVGLGQRVEGALASANSGAAIERMMEAGERVTLPVAVSPYIGQPGDVDRDADVDAEDVSALVSLLNTFADGFGDPADINRDGRIDSADLGLLDVVIEVAAVRTIDFDTGSPTPIVNGQMVTTGVDWTLTTAGANFGAAAFESYATGANTSSADPDLLVGTGNILILQGNAAMSTPGVFDFPGDSLSGGSMLFELASPSRLLSLDLVDIDRDPFLSQDARVILTDSSMRHRVFDVPAGWTSDINVEGAGIGTLDLESLAPQAGFGATATATEDPGFNASDVIGVEIEFSASGGVDNIRFVGK